MEGATKTDTDDARLIASDPATKPSSETAKHSSGSIHVSSRQKGNPVLKHIRNVPWEFVEGLAADYLLGQSCVALFLSVRYFTLQPNYIHDRLKALGSGHRIRILLVLVDVKDPHHALNQLMRICILRSRQLTGVGHSGLYSEL